MPRFWLLLVCVLLTVSVQAAPPAIDIQPALAPTLFQERWQPLLVTVTNPGDGTILNGEVQVVLTEANTGSVQGTFIRPLALPAGAGQVQASVLVAVPGSGTPEIDVYLMNGKAGSGTLVAQRHFRNVLVTPPMPLALVVSGQPDTLSYLHQEALGVVTNAGSLQKFTKGKTQQRYTGYSSQPQAAPPLFTVANLLTSQNLPETAPGYDAVTIVYLGPDVVPDAFTDRQIAALRQWVSAGGCLVIGRTPLAEPRIRSDERFRTWIPLFPPSGSTPWEAHTTGRGHLFLLGGDPALMAPVAGLSFWRKLVGEASAPVNLTRVLSDGTPYTDSLASATLFAPGTEAPAIGNIGLFLMLYLVILVPVNYLILKRLKKREWAWVTVPVVVVLFSISAYGFGYATKGTQMYVNTASVIEMSSGAGTASVTGAVGIFSPVRSRYAITARTGDAVFGTVSSRDTRYRSDTATDGNLALFEGEAEAVVRDADVPMWAMRGFTVRTQALALGDGIESHLTISGSPSAWKRVTGTITNRTGHQLENVIVGYRGVGQKIGALAPRQTVKIDIDRTHPGYPTTDDFGVPAVQPWEGDRATKTPTDQRRLVQAAIASAVRQSGFKELVAGSGDNLVMTGWMEGPILPVAVDGKSDYPGAHYHLVYVHL